jgi:feruloyl esterase
VYLFGLGACLSWASPLSAQDCEALARLTLPATTIAIAEPVPAGSFSPPGGKPLLALPAFCRVAGVMRPTSDSEIRFEVWMPSARWTGRFHGVGNGGFAGSISYSALADALRRGDATASTDTGHQSDQATDARWALGHPEKVTDFGHRAVHLTAVNAKAIIKTFYARAPRRSYFSSCSNGGRQALMEAQRYPEDFDGIIAGAPANNWTHLLSTGAWNLTALLSRDVDYIPAPKLPAIEAAALAACDTMDGVKDGTIEDPARCRFDPSSLMCQSAESAACLTAPQIAALKKLYAGSSTPQGQRIFPGYSPGGEAQQGGWAAWITGTAPRQSLMYAFATQFFANMVFGDPAWDFRTFDLMRDTRVADEKLAGILNATDPNLRRFQARGGRLLLYHGWSDAAIAASSTVDYYDRVVGEMGQRQTQGSVRLFMVPGMQHCSGGTGPDLFGQSGAAGDADHDIRVALERWVEQGVAPERIIATKRATGPAATGEVVRTWPLCAYPLVARYTGTGSMDNAASFACVNPSTPARR